MSSAGRSCSLSKGENNISNKKLELSKFAEKGEAHSIFESIFQASSGANVNKCAAGWSQHDFEGVETCYKLFTAKKTWGEAKGLKSTEIIF